MIRGRNAGVRFLIWTFAAVAVLYTARLVEAHAILKESSPAANSSVAGPDIPIRLKFNVRVDATRSKIELLLPDTTTTNLPLLKQPTADTIAAKATGLKPGAYAIRWQVLAPDGHITRGEIPFKVAGS